MMISFVIPALNEEQHIERCLQSIRALEQTPLVDSVEILTVDNESTDRTAAIAESFGSTVLRVPPGRPARARNAGAAKARGEILAFVDSDCELPRKWLIRLAQYLQEPGVCAVGCVMAEPVEPATWVERSWYALAHAPSSSVRAVPWLPSFNLMVRRSAFEAVGGFDENLVTGEDVDLGYRLSARGQLLRDGTLGSRHLGESKSLREFFRREVWRGRGSLPGLRRHGFRLDEIPSIAGPLGFAFALALGGVALVAGAFEPRLAMVGLTLLVIGCLIPAAVALGRGVGSKLFLYSWLLLAAYLSARALGLVWSMQRVSR